MNQEPGVQNNYKIESFEQKNRQRQLKRFAGILIIAFVLLVGLRGYPYFLRAVAAFFPNDIPYFQKAGWVFVKDENSEQIPDYKKISDAGKDLERVEKNIQILSAEVASLEASASFDYSKELEFDVYRVKEFLNSH